MYCIYPLFRECAYCRIPVRNLANASSVNASSRKTDWKTIFGNNLIVNKDLLKYFTVPYFIILILVIIVLTANGFMLDLKLSILRIVFIVIHFAVTVLASYFVADRKDSVFLYIICQFFLTVHLYSNYLVVRILYAFSTGTLAELNEEYS